VGTDTGVWHSVNQGANWTPLGTPFPNVQVFDLEIQRAARKLVAVTYGRGVWEFDLPPAPGTAVPPLATHPELMLDPPRPNPVTDRATFRYASRAAGPVALEIHDVRGRLVARVVERVPGDGIIRLAEWTRAGTPPGAYFATLRSASGSVTRKLVLAD
jgi:hypothetical protein